MTDDARAMGALSVDQAVEALSAPAPEPEKKIDEHPAEPTADAAEPTPQGEPAEEAGGEKPEAEGEQAPEPPPLEAPKFWDAEAKKWFGELPRERQDYILRKEDERNQATARAMQETAERRKTADGEGARWKALADTLTRILPEAEKTFQDRWANVNWNAVIDQYGANEALKLQNQMAAERAQVQALQNAQGQVELESRQQFLAEEAGKLASVAPDLADPKEGTARREQVAKFLLEIGIPPDRVNLVSAVEAGLAYDAMRWRQGQATARTLMAKPKTAPAARQAPVKPTGAGSPRSSTQARIDVLNRKRELSIDEAVELANLKGAA